MLFSVIYEFDALRNCRLENLNPPKSQRKLWICTEGDSNRQYDYLDESGDGPWSKAYHRKWCAVLTKEQFKEFADHVGLSRHANETMGMIGSPHGALSAPAFAFDMGDSDYIGSAFVCPLPNVQRKCGKAESEKNWTNIKHATENLVAA